MNSEEQFEVSHYLSKNLQLFTKSTGSASEWFFSTIYLSLVGLFPTVEYTKKTVIPTPGLFIERKNAVSFKNFFRKCREPDLHCINKKTEYPHLKRKQTTGVIVSRVQKYFVYTHKKTTKSLFYLPTFTIPPALGPKALDFSRRLPRGRMVADKKEQGF